MPAMAKEERFEQSWYLLHFRHFEGLDILVSRGQWWPAAALCSIAIDIFADTLTDGSDASATEYAKFLQDDEAV
jgi:hypothetical protein